MEKEDARKFKSELQKGKCKIAIRMRMNGLEFSKIGETIGVHHRLVQCWRLRHGVEGLKAAIEGGKRGTEIGEFTDPVRATAASCAEVHQREDAGANQAVLCRV